MHGSWDHIANISTCSKHFLALKKRIADELETSYRGRGHTTPDTSALVWQMVNDLSQTKVQVFTQNRDGNDDVKAFIDLYAKGHHQLISASLKTFNKHMQDFRSGGVFVPEIDELSPGDFDNVLGDDMHDMHPGLKSFNLQSTSL